MEGTTRVNGRTGRCCYEIDFPTRAAVVDRSAHSVRHLICGEVEQRHAASISAPPGPSISDPHRNMLLRDAIRPVGVVPGHSVSVTPPLVMHARLGSIGTGPWHRSA